MHDPMYKLVVRGSGGVFARRAARPRVCARAVVAALLTLLASSPPALAGPSGNSAFGRSHRPVCARAAPGSARCNADVVTDATGAPLTTSAPQGYGPDDLRAAYALGDLAATGGTAATVAIVDAYDDPSAESDLAVYRSQYGLPDCTVANGCFRKVDQRGGTAYPATNAGWAQEISLDLDMVSAVCPNCRILLVEADSTSMADLGTAVDTAAALGATQISNSYGGDEYRGETTDEAHYDHAGIAVVASSGDSGYGVEFPAASRYVTAVGGTRLVRDPDAPGGWSESAWTGGGSGCSAYIPKPSWQTDPSCDHRTVADVAAVADPDTGVAVYDSVDYEGSSGWMIFGGTSVAAPIVAGVDALLGAVAAAPSYPYAQRSAFFDVLSGSNGSCASGYLCTAVAGYDGPTGLGTPDGMPLASPPQATTGAASAVSDTAATPSGTVNPNGAATSAHFLYGTTTAYGLVSPDEPVGLDSADHPVSAVLSGLRPDTTYHFRLVASADCGCRDGSASGADATFRTAGAPSATTGVAEHITATAATFGGVVDPDGLATTYRFEYGRTTGYGQRSADFDAGTGRGGETVAVPVSDLDPAATYHFRLVAVSAAGTAYGADATVVTSPAPVLADAAAPVPSPTPSPDPTPSPGPAPSPAPTSPAPAPDVAPAPSSAPTGARTRTRQRRFRVVLVRQRMARALRHGLIASVSCPSRCRIRARAMLERPAAHRSAASRHRHGRTVARATRRLARQGRVRIAIRFGARARRALARVRSVRLRVRVTAVRPGHSTRTSLIKVRLRR